MLLSTQTIAPLSRTKLMVEACSFGWELFSRVSEFRARLVHGAVLTMPLSKPSFQVKPQALVPLDEIGVVYPTMTLKDSWGTLTVDSGGVLMRKQPNVATVSSVGFDPATLRGEGFILNSNPGWGYPTQYSKRAGDSKCRRCQSVAMN